MQGEAGELGRRGRVVLKVSLGASQCAEKCGFCRYYWDHDLVGEEETL